MMKWGKNETESKQTGGFYFTISGFSYEVYCQPIEFSMYICMYAIYFSIFIHIHRHTYSYVCDFMLTRVF